MSLSLNPLKTLRLGGPSLDLWLLLCTLAGIAFWWLSLQLDQRSVAPSTVAVDLAIGKGLPLLSAELDLQSRGISYLNDVDDVAAAVTGGLARIGIDAGPRGVQIVHRPEGGHRVHLLAEALGRRWDDAETRMLIAIWDPQRLALLLAVLFVLNVGALAARRQLQQLHSGEWLRWLVAQGKDVPALIVGLLARQSLRVATLGGFAFIGLLGLQSISEILPLVGLLGVCTVWLAVLLSVTQRVRIWLWLGVNSGIGLSGLCMATDAGVGMLPTTAPVLLAVVLLLGGASVPLGPRLSLWFRGGVA
ncbi:MAG: hypothetical protein MUE46_12440 [Xanthomonadales bacterium]|jgi:hypothetical protein|nr:hypothetical protein [Xanthomonadales bacterium]